MSKEEVEKMSGAIAVKTYFGLSLTQMKEEYIPLSDADKKFFAEGAKAELLATATA